MSELQNSKCPPTMWDIELSDILPDDVEDMDCLPDQSIHVAMDMENSPQHQKIPVL